MVEKKMYKTFCLNIFIVTIYYYVYSNIYIYSEYFFFYPWFFFHKGFYINLIFFFVFLFYYYVINHNKEFCLKIVFFFFKICQFNICLKKIFKPIDIIKIVINDYDFTFF